MEQFDPTDLARLVDDARRWAGRRGEAGPASPDGERRWGTGAGRDEGASMRPAAGRFGRADSSDARSLGP